ncbi:macrolide family glycosyltransferase [Microlunatus sp. GCM10028923]|uniref:macrolide family glycosyltransferase n=1 Tax=Microlunatus sp. GCM10028923 TaxID=3273400 RepID=UPI0036129CED
MTRIVFTAMPAAGHVNPSAPLIRELVRRKLSVTCYATEEFRDQLTATGADFRPYPADAITSEDIATATREGSPLRVVARVLTATERLVPFLQQELRRDPADAIAYDSNAVWGRMAATDAGLPTISLMTTMLAGAESMRGMALREWLQFIKLALPDLPGVVGARGRVVKQFGDLFPPSPVFPMRGDLTIFPIPRWLQLPDPRIDDSCHYVGPTFDPAVRTSVADPELAALLAGSEPLIMVSLGTLHAGSDEFFRSCFAALGDLPARVVLSVGRHTDPARLGTPPSNTLVRASVPQFEVLARADLFVTHGGMNSVLEGLRHAVPLVIIPQQFEQLVIGRAVAERGAGVVLRQNLSGRPVPPEALRSAVDQVRSDSAHAAAARTIADGLGQEGGAAAAAELIDRFLAERSASRAG